MARYHIETYGCTSNRGETQQIEQALREGGHHPADGPESADVAIINTCTVLRRPNATCSPGQRVREETPADLIITGCMALAQGEEFREEDVDAQILHWDDVPRTVTTGNVRRSRRIPRRSQRRRRYPPHRSRLYVRLLLLHHEAGDRARRIAPVEENVEKARALVHAGAKEIRITAKIRAFTAGIRIRARAFYRSYSTASLRHRRRFPSSCRLANPKGLHGVR